MKVNGGVIFEITRQCNLQCEHCLRGDAQNMVISKEIIDKTLDNISAISHLTITGGEPSLHPEIIQYIYEQIVERKIELGSFFIATNGIEYSDLFVLTCLKLYAISHEKECCALSISIDLFHGYEADEMAMLVYRSLAFYSEEKEHDANEDIDSWVITRGKAEEYSIGYGEKEVTTQLDWLDVEVYDDECVISEYVYISANGNIVFDCDLPYTKQDKCALGNILNDSLSDIIIANTN